jgi:hypothetical protein
MAKLSKLQRTKHIAFQWPDSDEVLNMVVLPDRFTGHNLEVMQNAINGRDEDSIVQHRFLCEFLCIVVDSWDLEDDSGIAIPINKETVFELLPITLVAALLSSIQKELRVNPQTPEL